MFIMILKMSAVTALHVLLTALIWKYTHNKKLTLSHKIIIGIIYGGSAVLSTHFGIDFSHMLLNVRDLGPLSAGLFFDPLSGILAGLIGGIERYIAGTYWGVGSYTRIACSVSTCLAGVVAALLHIYIFKRKRPTAIYAFFMGAVMEVFHMYVVFITHRNDMEMAFYVVKICSPPMIVFTGGGLAASSILIKIISGNWRNPFTKRPPETVSVTQQFQRRLFAVIAVIILMNVPFSYTVQTQTALQEAEGVLISATSDIHKTFDTIKKLVTEATKEIDFSYFHVGSRGTYDIILLDDSSTPIFAGNHQGMELTEEELKRLTEASKQNHVFTDNLFQEDAMCLVEQLSEYIYLLTRLPMSEVYAGIDAQAYESAFSVIILVAVLYVLISVLVNAIVVDKLQLVNKSLDRISKGNLDEVVTVRDSREFASLSDDINKTVSALKGYIEAEKNRMEEELELARTIQDSALPKDFVFPRNDFELYATMDPAKEVGGDFYDFFFTDRDKVALVIADVSGKGVPAALFMMRAKTAIQGLAKSGLDPAEILSRANNSLCEGNDAEMFVTVWLGIVDLTNGKVRCANAGHEYPLLLRAGGDFDVLKDKHGPPLATMEGLRYREYELQLQPCDRLFVYTDGIPEAIDEKTEAYGIDRLREILNTWKAYSMEEILPAVREDIQKFVMEAEQFDDITMLGFSYFGKGVDSDEGTDV